MDTIKDYINWNVVIWFVLFLTVFIFFGCGSDDDTADELMESETTDLTTQTPTTETQEQINEPIALEAHTFMIDATIHEEWAYFSFETGDVVEVADAMNSDAWDIGFQRTKVKLNGGISGPGMGSAVMLADTTFEDVDTAPEDGYRSDTDDTLAIVAQSEKGWYIYTGPPTHWILPLEDRVFVIKAADGTFAKLHFIGYYKDNANKQDSGFVTFEYAHQPDGTRNF
ncbi:hypothetical protein F4212_13330 [Candidatus Poribacteria bacterium]|nr:hypothetical protein [Candidatus Poribacteria bacterium]